MDNKTQLALIRVKDKAKINALDSVILDWIRSVGADIILESSLKDIRSVASCF
jgi:hypothetical protein